MQNEHFYRQELENKIEEWLDEMLADGDHEFGYVSDNLVENMANAAWSVISQNTDSNNFFKKEGLFKED